jgi:hypothetical protein
MACTPCQQKARKRLEQQEIKKIATAPKAKKISGTITYNNDEFCPRCRWRLRKIKTYDPKTGLVTDKQACTNKKCRLSK